MPLLIGMRLEETCSMLRLFDLIPASKSKGMQMKA